tara:strand:- start:200 stop:1138 length:939 start_codon:yes stop_codon:yes gene_type:complete
VSSQGFFSFGDNFDEQIASNFDDYTIEDKKNVINFQKKLQNDPNYTPKPYESESLRRQMKAENETFSPRGGEVARFASLDGGVNVARADKQELSEEENYKAYMKLQGIRYPKTLSDMFHNLNRSNMRQDIKELRYKDGQFLNKAEPEEEKGNILQRIAGSIFDAATFTQPAAADVLDGRINFNNSVPSTSTFSETGDPSFRSYRMGQDFADSIQGIGNLPSDYKSTEAKAFKKAENFKRQIAEDKKIQGIIDRNPRLTRGADGSVKAVQKTRAEAGASARTAAGNRARVKANAKARAKAAAVNRRKKKNKNK